MQSRYLQIALFPVSTMFVQTNLVHGTLSAVNNFKNHFGRLLEERNL